MSWNTEAEILVLIALAGLADPFETLNNIHYRFHPKDLEEARSYFRGSLAGDKSASWRAQSENHTIP